MKPITTDFIYRQHAQLLYTQEDKTIKEIALAIAIDEPTLNNWKDAGSWDAIKTGLLTSNKANLKLLQALLTDLLTKIKTADTFNPRDADQALKYSAAIKNMEKDVSIAEIVEVAELFVLWLLPHNTQLAITIADQVTAFINHRVKEGKY